MNKKFRICDLISKIQPHFWFNNGGFEYLTDKVDCDYWLSLQNTYYGYNLLNSVFIVYQSNTNGY